MEPASVRWAWITGGSSGIGLALAELLLREGWRVVLMARGEDGLLRAHQRLVSDCEVGPDYVVTAAVDVSVEADVEHVVDRLLAGHGVPQWVILSAGVAEPGYFHALPAGSHRQQMEVNYFGSLWMARAVLEPMASAGGGHLVFVSSVAGLIGVYGYSGYSPGKFAVRGLAEVLAAEYRRRGVQVSVVYPPDTNTPMLAAENRVKPVETRRIAASGGLWEANAVARVILDGVRRKKFMIAPGFENRLLARLHSLILPLLQWWMDRAAHQDNA